MALCPLPASAATPESAEQLLMGSRQSLNGTDAFLPSGSRAGDEAAAAAPGLTHLPPELSRRAATGLDGDQKVINQTRTTQV